MRFTIIRMPNISRAKFSNKAMEYQLPLILFDQTTPDRNVTVLAQAFEPNWVRFIKSQQCAFDVRQFATTQYQFVNRHFES